MLSNQIKTEGSIEYIIDWANGQQECCQFRNTVLTSGRRALSFSLANNIGQTYQYYVTKMLFGDGGTVNGVKRFVNANRDGLFGITRLSKSALASIDPNVLTQVIFTSVIKFDEAVGVTLNEMALQMANGSLFSMSTFADLNKTEDMQITFNWRCCFV